MPALQPMKMFLAPEVLPIPAHKPAKKLLLPVVLAAPAQQPTKKLLQPEPPVPDIVLVMLLVLQHLNTAAAVGTMLPLMYRPVLFTHSLLQPPGARITVEVSAAVPVKLVPIMMLHPPVVTQQPEQLPMNMFWSAVLL